jgi:alpha-tubulin suppressor-like RCC1 family protein
VHCPSWTGSCYSHTAALTEAGKVFCWGEKQCAVPKGLGFIVSISCGGECVVAMTREGAVFCWGSNAFAQCLVPSHVNACAISCGLTHTAALASDGSIICWGSDHYHQSTVPENTKAWIPQMILM